MARRWLLALTGVLVLSLVLAATAGAANFTASELDDNNSDGDCDAPATCTIRDAVDDAMETSEDDVITVTAGRHELSDSGDIEILSGNGAVTINGAGAGSTVVDANGFNRVFTVFPDAVATITGLTLEDGSQGNGGAILNGGSLTLDGMVLRNNEADNDGGAIENALDSFLERAGLIDDDTPDLLIRNSTIGGTGAGDENEALQDGGGISTKDGVVTLENTAVEGNIASGDDGGGISMEGRSFNSLGGPLPSGTLNVTAASRVDGNFAEDDGGGISGDDDGEVNVRDSQVNGNFSLSDGGGIKANDAITLTVERSVINGNVADNDGGGINNEDDSETTIVESTVSGNTTDFNFGGGLFSDEGSLTVVRSTISGNGGVVDLPDSKKPVAAELLGAAGETFAGGGIAVVDGASLDVVNSTVSGNTAFRGGGLYVSGGFSFEKRAGDSPELTGFSNAASADLLHVTLVDNTVFDSKGPGEGAGMYIENFGGDFSPGVVNTKSTLLANNLLGDGTTKENCNDEQAPGSEGTNLEDADTCGFNSTGGDGDLVNTNPNIGPLADNGGPTFTHALLDGSPAIHAASNSGCPTEDQRNVVRPQGPACDIGAYEVEVSAAPPAAGVAPAPTTTAPRPARPTVRVAGVGRRCVRTSLRVTFRIAVASGARLTSVRLTVDGRRVRTRTRSRLTVRINVRRLRAGRHRLRLVVRDSAGNRTTVNRTFTKCAQRAQRRTAPRFTG